MIDEDLVETSDVEELAELEKEGLPSSPLTRKSVIQEHVPRKRIKLFHNREQPFLLACSPKRPSSPLQDHQPVRSTPIKHRESRLLTLSQLDQENPVTPSSSAGTRSSSTAPVMGSPVSRPLFSSRSPTRTPLVIEFSSKNVIDDENCPAGVWSSSSPDPVCLQSPSWAEAMSMATSPVDSNFLESQIDFDMNSLPPDNTIRMSTTPPGTPDPISRSPSPKQSVPSPHSAPPQSSSPIIVNDLLPLQTNAHPPNETVDKLLLFSPTKPASQDRSSTTPILGIQHTSVPPTENSLTSSATDKSHPTGPFSVASDFRGSHSPVSPVLHPFRSPQQEAVSHDVLDPTTAEAEQPGRYSFRKRKAAQLAPYTAELIQYKHALKSNPDAIVKMKQIERDIQHQQQYKHPDDHYEEDEEDYGNRLDAADDADWEERERRKQRRLERERENAEEQHNLYNLPAILQEFQSTDEEEKEMDAASKEARRILRAKERERKLRDEEQQRRKEEEEQRRRERRPKPYPVSRPGASPFQKTAEPESERYSSPPFPSFRSGPKDTVRSQTPEVSNDGEIIEDYFHNEDFEVFDSNDNPNGQIHSDDEERAKGYSSISDVIDLDSKRHRILRKMLPWGLAVKLAQKEEEKVAERASSPVRDMVVVVDDGPLLPGQTRVRKVTNSKDIKDIKGDSESEEEERPDPPSSSSSSTPSSSNESDSDSDSVEILQTYRRRVPQPKREVIEVTDSDGDEDIQFFVQNTRPDRKPRRKTKLRDQSLIDYMLQRGYTADRPHQNSGSQRKKSSKFEFDIMTKGSRGQGRGHQLLLSFEGHKRRRRDSGRASIVPGDSATTSRTSFARTTSRSSGDMTFRDSGPVNGVHDQNNHVQSRKQLSRKEREKLRKLRAKQNGVYNFASGDYHITNGRRVDAAFVTLDLQDEAFHSLLAPIAGPRPRFEPPKKRKNYERTHSGNAFEPESHMTKASSVDPPAIHPSDIREIAGDLNIKRLNSGRSFCQSTYIRKGWLHELVNLEATVVGNNMEPPATIFCRFELGPKMGVEKFCLALPKLLDVLFDIVTDILNVDSDFSSEWKPGFRVTSQIVSWYLVKSGDSEKAMLRDTIDKEVPRIANLIDKHFTKEPGKSILSLCWFLVELSARASIALPTTYDELSLALKDTSKVMIKQLLRLGLHDVSKLLQSNGILDESSPIQYATELWVGLIHVLLGASKDGLPKSKAHPFWTVFMDSFSTVQDKDPSQSFKASEDFWLTIFTLCTLSQFSVHGMATTEPRLPAFWDLVVFGLKLIRLTENENQKPSQSGSTLRQRDRYVALVVARCGHLRDAWNWRLDGGTLMFHHLSEIFRSRNFANLRHDEQNLPKFFRHADWNLLSVHDSTDTAFSCFLKLILQANRDDEDLDKKSVKLKKLLSLAVPLRSLSFTTSQPPHGRDFSMFYNRLSAIALALFLDANDHDERIKKARSYLAFSSADTKTRHTIICGWGRLAVLIIKRDISLRPMLDWIEEVGKTLETDLKGTAPNIAKPRVPGEEPFISPAANLVGHLFLWVSKIATTYINASRFPDPHLLDKLKSILGSQVMKGDTLKNDFALLLDEVFTARSKALPRATRPFTPEEDSEESQNYFAGFDDIDFGALDDLPDTSDLSEKDRIFRQNVDPKLKWTVYHHLKSYLSKPPPPFVSTKAYSNECDRWLRLWLCCNEFHQSQGNKWASCVKLLDDVLQPDTTKDNDHDEQWAYRVNLSIMFQLLQLDPMAYLTYMNRSFQVCFRALVSDTLSLESQYTSYLLSIDCLRHPLFAGCGAHLPPRDPVSADYQFSTEEFEVLKLPLIAEILRNIERSLSHDDPTELESKLTYIDLCHKMFSWMRRVRSLLLQKCGQEADKVVKYTQFCGKVLQTFQEYPLLRSQARLEFFSGWARTLTIPQ